MKKFVLSILLCCSAITSLAQGTITYRLGYDEYFRPYVYGEIVNNSQYAVTSVEVVMHYGYATTPPDYVSYNLTKVAVVNIEPGKSGTYQVYFQKDVKGKKPVLFHVTRLRLSDGTVKEINSTTYVE